jgi:hypothetical protein
MFRKADPQAGRSISVLDPPNRLRYGRAEAVTTPKVIPTLDDTPREPRIIPKRCPRCGSANRPDASTCTTCKFDFSGPPPLPSQIRGPKVARSGGGGAKTVLIVFVILVAAAGGAIAYLGPDKALAFVQSLYKPPAPAPLSPKEAAQAAARDAQRKTIALVKSDAGLCFTQFNELMESAKRPVDPNALLQSYVHNGLQFNTVTTLSAGCSGDTKVVPDAQKTDLCDAAAQLKTCLTTVMTMQHDRLQAAGYRVNGSVLEKIVR